MEMIKGFGTGIWGCATYVQRRGESQVISWPLVDDRSSHASVDSQCEIFSNRQQFNHVLFAVCDHFKTKKTYTMLNKPKNGELLVKY